MPFVSYGAALAIFSLARLFVWGVPAVVGLLWIALRGGDVRRGIALLVSAGLIAVIVAWAAQRLVRWLARHGPSQFSRLAQGCLRVTSSRRVARSALVAMLGCSSTQVVAFYFVFRSSSLPVGLVETIVITASHQLSSLVGLTPGGLGIQETVSLLFSTLLGVRIADMLMVLALMRVARVLLAAAVGAPCWWLLPTVDSRDDVARARNVEVPFSTQGAASHDQH